MMKKTLLISTLVAAAFLAGCAKSDEQLIVQACENSDANASEAFCTCTYEQMEAGLPAATIEAIADQIRKGAKTPQEAIGELPQAMQLQTLPVLPLLLNCIDAE